MYKKMTKHLRRDYGYRPEVKYNMISISHTDDISAKHN